MSALGIEPLGNWTPEHAGRLLERCGDDIEEAYVALALVRDRELARLDRAIAAARVNRPIARRRLESEARDARIAVCREWMRRCFVLQDVARAHGLIGGTR